MTRTTHPMRLFAAVSATLLLTLLACGHLILLIQESYFIYLYKIQHDFTWFAIHLLLGSSALWAATRASLAWLFYASVARWTNLPRGSDVQRDLERDVHRARQEEDWAAVADLLSRHLEKETEDRAAPYNLASALALNGDHAAAVQLIKETDPDSARLRWLVRRSEAGQGAASKGRWPRGRQLSASRMAAAARTSNWLVPLLLVGLIAGPPLLLRGAILASFYYRVSRGFDDQGFKKIAGKRFDIHYHDAAFADWASEAVDDALDANLEFFEVKGQWEGPMALFDGKPLRIFLCDSQREMIRRSPGAGAWMAGYTVPKKNLVVVFRPEGDRRQSEISLRVLLAHELNHAVWYRLTRNAAKESWLSEGLAEYVAYTWVLKENNIAIRRFLNEHIFAEVSKKPLPFEVFLNSRPGRLKGHGEIERFYNQGFSMVFVLIEEYGKDTFLDFMRDVAKTGDVGGSFARAYPTIGEIRNLKAIWELFYQE